MQLEFLVLWLEPILLSSGKVFGYPRRKIKAAVNTHVTRYYGPDYPANCCYPLLVSYLTSFSIIYKGFALAFSVYMQLSVHVAAFCFCFSFLFFFSCFFHLWHFFCMCCVFSIHYYFPKNVYWRLSRDSHTWYFLFVLLFIRTVKYGWW